MKVLSICFALLFLAASVSAQSNDLKSFRWKNRILLLFAPDSADSTYASAMRQLKHHSQGVQERQLVIFHLFERGTSFRDSSRISTRTVNNQRTQYRVASGKFTAVLIGKDGGEKWRQTEMFDLDALFRRIDAMPMRQSEIQVEEEP